MLAQSRELYRSGAVAISSGVSETVSIAPDSRVRVSDPTTGVGLFILLR